MKYASVNGQLLRGTERLTMNDNDNIFWLSVMMSTLLIVVLLLEKLPDIVNGPNECEHEIDCVSND